MPIGLPEQPASLLTVPGVRLAATAAGIRKRQRDDLILIALPDTTTTAAVFTRNAFCAAPVQLAREHLQSGSPRYLLINAGNANAGTGAAGLEDARYCCQQLAQLADAATEQVLPFSTGVIGEPLPVSAICAALPDLLAQLDEQAWLAAATAMMTTDTVPKGISRQIDIDGVTVTVTGIAKGAGMIRPDMATMLSFIACDAPVDTAVLQHCLTEAVEHTFNRITVDGDTSTNDACVLMATATAEMPRIEEPDSAAYKQLTQAVSDVCRYLAMAIIRDAEGVSKFITIEVLQGDNEQECLDVAYTVAHSPLVKTAFFASDPNWGRILAAVGRAGINDLDIDAVSIHLGDVCLVDHGGRVASYSEDAGAAVMAQEEITVRIALGRGTASARVWTSDLSYDYVRINAEYRT